MTPPVSEEGDVPVNEDAALIAERASMYETLRSLREDEWNRASLCAGWRIRDVASHVEILCTTSRIRLARGLLSYRGDRDAFLADAAVQAGIRPPETILAAWAHVASSAVIPPTTKPVDLAMDCFVHHHDIALPLGREVPSDAARLRWMADGMVAAKKSSGPGRRVEGLRLIATDIDWHYGTGPEIQGPAAALILAGCGRDALHGHLSGTGVDDLVRRS